MPLQSMKLSFVLNTPSSPLGPAAPSSTEVASAPPAAAPRRAPESSRDGLDVGCDCRQASGGSQSTQVSDRTNVAARSLLTFAAQENTPGVVMHPVTPAAAAASATRKRPHTPSAEAKDSSPSDHSVRRQRSDAPSIEVPHTPPPPAGRRGRLGSPWPRTREARPQQLERVVPASMNLLHATSLAPGAQWMALMPPGGIRPQVVAAPYRAPGPLLAAAPINTPQPVPPPRAQLTEAEVWLNQHALRLAAFGLRPESQRHIMYQLPKAARPALLEHLPALMTAGYAPDDVAQFVLHRGNGTSLPALARVLPLFAARHYSAQDVSAFLSVGRVRERLAAFEADTQDFDALADAQRALVMRGYWYL